jgi:hypothetical protein
MNTLIKTAVVALALASGALSAQADTFAVHGYQGTVYGGE